MNIPLIPTPPTDNLYKFISLSGVVLFILAPFFWANFYISQSERTQMAIEELANRVPPPDYYEIKSKIENGLTVNEEQKKLIEKYDALIKESRHTGRQYLIYDKFRIIVNILAAILFLLGCVLMYFGFRFWYLRVQKPMDLIIKNQTEKKEDSA